MSVLGLWRTGPLIFRLYGPHASMHPSPPKGGKLPLGLAAAETGWVAPADLCRISGSYVGVPNVRIPTYNSPLTCPPTASASLPSTLPRSQGIHFHAGTGSPHPILTPTPDLASSKKMVFSFTCALGLVT